MSERSHMAPGSTLTSLCVGDESAHCVARGVSQSPRVPLISHPSAGSALILLSINEDESSNEVNQ